MSATTPNIADEQVILMPRTNLRESPFNSRKTYSSASLNEMAQSMMPPTGRIHSPLVVRSLYQADIEQTHEIVFGHRRFRAAGLAGLDKVPVIIREMSEEEARIVQLIENAQREDVTALEEADSLHELRRACGVTIEKLIERTGMSRSYVYGRLKLATSAPEVRKATIEQGLSAEIALEIARRPHHDQQRRALKDLRVSHQESAERPIVWMSTREAKQRLSNMFTTSLDSAPFSLEDQTLAERAGACTSCAQRAGNDPDLASLDANTCMDRQCFDSKVTQHELRRIEELRASGHTVLLGDEAKAAWVHWWNDPDGMESVTGLAYSTPTDDVTFAEALAALGDAAPKPTYIASPNDGKLNAFLTVQQANDVLRALGQEALPPETTVAERQAAHAAAEAAKLADWTPKERLTKDQASWQLVRRKVIERLAMTQRNTSELRALLIRELEMAGEFGFALEALGIEQRMHKARDASGDEDFDETAWLIGWIGTASPDELGALLAAIAIDDILIASTHTKAEATNVVEIVEAYGVDLAEFLPEPEQADLVESTTPKLVPAWPFPLPTPTPSPAAQAQDKGAAGGGKMPIKYRDPATGMTWSGRGLQPKWLKVAIAGGARLEDFDTTAAAQAQDQAAESSQPDPNAKQPGGAAAQKVTVDAAGLAADSEASATGVAEAL